MLALSALTYPLIPQLCFLWNNGLRDMFLLTCLHSDACDNSLPRKSRASRATVMTPGHMLLHAGMPHVHILAAAFVVASKHVASKHGKSLRSTERSPLLALCNS